MTTHTTRRRFLAAGGALAVSGACSSGRRVEPQSAGSDQRASDRKTFVLLHGSWHGGWCWARVAEPLRAAGHRVYTPTLTGLGERSHLLSREISLKTFVTDLVNVLRWEDVTGVVLVGHSFGGVGVIGAADQTPERIRHLVLLDSLILRNGESAFSVLPPDVAAARRASAQQSSGGLSVPVPEASAFGITDPADATWVKEKCTPHPLSTYEDKMVLNAPVGNGIAATYIAVTPPYGSTASSREFAKQQSNWRYVEIAAGHDAMVTTPRAVTELLLEI